jgi:hypothetical protein
MKVPRTYSIEQPNGADVSAHGRAHLDRLERLAHDCSVVLADARRVEAARRAGASAGPWLARAGDILEEMDELLALAGPAAPSAIRDRVASLRHEEQRLRRGATNHATP